MIVNYTTLSNIPFDLLREKMISMSSRIYTYTFAQYIIIYVYLVGHYKPRACVRSRGTSEKP